MRRPSLLFVALLTLAAAVAAQSERPEAQPRRDEALRVYAYTMKHQPVGEALPLVQPLLSPRGTVELRPGDNTLVIRDSLAAISKISPILHRFDRPAHRLRIEVMILEAQRAPVSPVVPPEALPDGFTLRLRGFLPYDGYRLLARTAIEVMEREQVTYELGEGFALSFRPGMVMGAELRLVAFRIDRTAEGRVRKHLFQSDLNLPLGRTATLGLTQAEDSPRALIVLITPSLAAEPRRIEPRRDGGGGT